MRALLLSVLSLSVLSGCLGNDGTSLFILGSVSPDPESDCALSGNYVLRGRFNPQVAQQYLLTPRLQNQVISRPLSSPAGADPNGIQLRNAVVELVVFNNQGEEQPDPFGGLNPEFTVPLSGYIAPAPGSSSATTYVTSLELIPPAYAPSLATLAFDLGGGGNGIILVTAKVHVLGKTVGGVNVETPNFIWPIDVGASVDYLFDCIGANAEDKAIGCLPGQDEISEIDNTSAMVMSTRLGLSTELCSGL